MCFVLLEDLDKAIAVFSGKMPSNIPIDSIQGNVHGDFIVKNDTDVYIIKHADWSLWKREGESWRTGFTWVEI